MKYIVTLRGKCYEVEVEAGEAMLLAEYEAKAPAAPAAPVSAAVPAAAVAPTPAAPAATGSGEPINSPMPGNILQINVVAGQAVKEGDILVVLEAMKMENEILAPRAGVINQVLTTKGATVETGTPLLTLG